ncbi:hypothetical protein ACPA0F_18160 [Solibacillus silvestris]
MPVPATTGQLRTNVSDMEIGDYVLLQYQSNEDVWKTFNEGKPELPVTPLAIGTHQSYFAYGIKVAKGLIIFDRVWYHSVKWVDVNSWKQVQGKSVTIQNNDGSTILANYRMPTGGVAYADVNGNKSLIDQGFGGWPTNNEWDRYIMNFPQGKIQAEKTSDDIFHWSAIFTFTQDTPINGLNDRGSIAGNTRRVSRGYYSSQFFAVSLSDTSASTVGFRPVFEYRES